MNAIVSVDLGRLQFGLARLLPAVDVGAVPAHQIVQAEAARREALGLGVICAVISPIASLITLRWNHGGRNVSSATIQRGGKITKSALARPGTSLGLVSTVKIDGSGWSKLTVPIVLKRARS